MRERNPLDPPAYPNDISDFNDTQTEKIYDNCGATQVARPTLIHNTTTRKLKMDYPWTIEPNTDAGTEYDSETSPLSTKEANSLHYCFIVNDD
ncbi:MAG: hypothetical protein EZS28_029234 [Streblomastix strix]|uniref:Uncharacterized protein n=1 Tax=Streblomastix strix TaxID=222440 RepID=A0A5J4UY16_9EUKA|nr:MAG: hypothetical protein EZS28_029234 [Streblomastix strix]